MVRNFATNLMIILTIASIMFSTSSPRGQRPSFLFHASILTCDQPARRRSERKNLRRLVTKLRQRFRRGPSRKTIVPPPSHRLGARQNGTATTPKGARKRVRIIGAILSGRTRIARRVPWRGTGCGCYWMRPVPPSEIAQGSCEDDYRRVSTTTAKRLPGSDRVLLWDIVQYRPRKPPLFRRRGAIGRYPLPRCEMPSGPSANRY